MDKGLSGKNAAFALAATLLGLTLQFTGGMYSAFGVGLLLITLLIRAGGMSISHAELTFKTARIFLLGLFILQIYAMLFTPPDESFFGSPHRWFYTITLTVAFVATLIIASAGHRIAIGAFALLLVTHAIIGAWTIHSVPKPFIDVFNIQTDAADALAHGHNPYSMTFEDIYGPRIHYFTPDMIKDGRVQYGYPYMPLSLLFAAPAHWLLGDPRYAYLLTILASGVLIAFIRPDRIGMLLAALFLFTPASFYILQMSWIEPLSVMLLFATVLCAIRFPRLMPSAMGLLLASKQYLLAGILIVPVLWTTTHRKSRRAKWEQLATIVGVAGLVTLPFALWDIRAFIHSAVELHIKMPYRPDSLSILAWWGSGKAGWTPPFWLSFAALGAAIAWSLWRIPRGLQGFVTAFGFCFFVFIAMSKQAFINYYYLVLAATFATAALENWTGSTNPADNTLSDHAPLTRAHLHALGFARVGTTGGGQPGSANI